MKIQPDLKTFREKCREGNLVPVWGEILADLETPVSAFKKLDDGEYAFLLESVEHGERIGRYSFIGCSPTVLIRSRASEVAVLQPGGEEELHDCPNVMEFLRDYMKRYRPVADPRLPPFVGGAVGFLSYDLVRRFEKLPDSNPDDRMIPDAFLMVTESLVAFDHVQRRLLIIHNAHVEDSSEKAPELAYEQAVAEIHRTAQRLRGPLPATDRPDRSKGDGGSEPAEVTSNMTREEYKAAVKKAREYILAGDAFQIVPSQRFQRPYGGDPFDVYRALRTINPSPYMFYLKYGGLILAGSSPEVLITVTGRKIHIRPIAGTRPRGATEEEDRALEEELLADPKERAEHIMLVDLSRNDCGRVSRIGSVRVEDLMVIERYSHVMHIVSSVVGELRPDCDGFDAFQAVFPHGTVSGAPKIRAMEIIDELEPVRRGAYAGAAGYFGFNGNIDTCITIRTAILQDGIAYIQAGGGVVADSDPEFEYQETLSKAKGMIAALEMAERGLE